MTKHILTLALVVVASVALAYNGFHPAVRHTAYRPHYRHHVQHRPVHHYHHTRYISPWIGLTVGTVVGAAIASSANRTVVVEKPVVVQQPIVQAPVVVQQPTQVWVEGRYVDQLQTTGTTIRVWQPGHWETR